MGVLFEQRTSWRLSQLDRWSDMGLGSGPTKAGVELSETTAEGLPTVFACVRVISSAVAQLPLKLYRVGDDGAKTEATDHPLYEVLHDLANPEMTAFDLRALLTSHLLLWGNAFAEIERDPAGRVVALWPLLPWRMHVDRDDRRRLRFRYAARDPWIFDPARPPIFRLMIHSQDGITGRSPVRVLRESMGLTLALQEFGAAFFKNGTTFGGILSAKDRDIDPESDDGKQIRETVAGLHARPDKAHRMLVLGGDWTFHQLGVPPEDAQFLESRKFQRSELCGAYGVPPHMIADLERATFSNVENESLRWLRDGLEPYLGNWEGAIRRDLIGPRAFSRSYARFTRNAMVRGDLGSRSKALATMRQNGIISANEWRALEEMDPIRAADGGDVYIVNTAAQPATAPDDDDARSPTVDD